LRLLISKLITISSSICSVHKTIFKESLIMRKPDIS